MKRKIKRIASLVLAMVMVFAMAMPAMAAEGVAESSYTITINDKNGGHNYKAYQIFKGRLEGGVLSDIDWGNGISEAGKAKLYDEYLDGVSADGYNNKENIAKLAKALQSSSDAAKMATFLGENGMLAISSDFRKNGDVYTLTVTEAGYYMIVDTKPEKGGITGNDVYSSYIVEIVESTRVDPKKSTPTVDKQVQDNDTDEQKDSSNGNSGTWGETADHKIGETFNFKLTATIPKDSDFAFYETYKLVFHDTMSAGITYGGIESVKVYVDDGAEPRYTLVHPQYSVEETEKTLTVTIDDLIGLMTQREFDGTHKIDVVVEYRASLNENAKVAPDGVNTNEVELEFSNNPNVGGDGTGRTPKDTVYVFTYEIPNQKVDGDTRSYSEEFATKMAEAEFELYKSDKNGNKIDGNKINLKAVTDADGNKYYYPINEAGDVLKPFVDKQDTFNIRGLDEGYYVLTETKAPSGYNKCEDIVIYVHVTKHEENGEGGTVTFEKKTTSGGTTFDKDYKGIIANFKGVTLPETGGMGTTIFYVIGSVLVLAAAVLLVTKKRMNAD